MNEYDSKECAKTLLERQCMAVLEYKQQRGVMQK